MLNKSIVLAGVLIGVVFVAAPGFGEEDDCRLQNCHGLDMTCGPSAPQVCTAMYRMGDFCRQFVSCRKLDGECRLVENREFRGCKSCVADCAQFKDPVAAFNCENGCRKSYEPSASRNRE